jgi:hypothetical protein
LLLLVHFPSQGNHYNTPGGTNSGTGSSYHYSNSNGSYYYKNDNGTFVPMGIYRFVTILPCKACLMLQCDVPLAMHRMVYVYATSSYTVYVDTRESSIRTG